MPNSSGGDEGNRREVYGGYPVAEDSLESAQRRFAEDATAVQALTTYVRVGQPVPSNEQMQTVYRRNLLGQVVAGVAFELAQNAAAKRRLGVVSSSLDAIRAKDASNIRTANGRDRRKPS